LVLFTAASLDHNRHVIGREASSAQGKQW